MHQIFPILQKSFYRYLHVHSNHLLSQKVICVKTIITTQMKMENKIYGYNFINPRDHILLTSWVDRGLNRCLERVQVGKVHFTRIMLKLWTTQNRQITQVHQEISNLIGKGPCLLYVVKIWDFLIPPPPPSPLCGHFY